MVRKEEYKELENAVKEHYNKCDKGTLDKYKDFDWKLVDKVGGIKDKKVLNLGCAYPVDEIKFGEEAGLWIAVDFAPEIIDRCWNLQDAKQISSKVMFFVMDITDLRLEDNQFDIILSFSTIDHLPDPAKRIKAHKEAYRVLKNGGFLIITFPNFLYPGYIREKESTRKFGYEYHYVPAELKKELESVGFKHIGFGGCDEDDARTSSRAGFIMKKEVI